MFRQKIKNKYDYLEKFCKRRSICMCDFENKQILWNLTSSDIFIAFQLAKKDNLKLYNVPEDNLYLFLYAKHLLDEHENTKTRKLKIKHLFADHRAKERLKRIVETGETSLNKLNGFDQFVQRHPEWSNPETSWVLFRDHPLLKDKKHAYVERVQKSGLCYMHGPVVMQHYLVSMWTETNAGMVDIVDYLRKHMSSESLINHIFQNAGGYSIAFLQSILGLKDHSCLEKPSIKSTDLPEYLHKYGAGLVSNFEVWSCFHCETIDVHEGYPKGQRVGNHSMVLIGYRYDSNNKIKYLMQNWWTNKLFVEMDAEYAHTCGAQLAFSNIKHEYIPLSFETNFSQHIEAMHDSCESQPLETLI